jgi:hypothetical protein
MVLGNAGFSQFPLSLKGKNMIRLAAFVLVNFAIIVLIPCAYAANECPDCVERKKQMCAKECQLVAPEHTVKCQSDCIKQYCAHRCTPNDPSFKWLSDPDCNDCLDQQYNLCASDCTTGTDRVRALCKLDCAKQRCVSNCPAAEEPASTK